MIGLYHSHKLTVMFTMFLVAALVDRYVRLRYINAPDEEVSRLGLRQCRLSWWIMTMSTVVDFKIHADWVWPIWQSYAISATIQLICLAIFVSTREMIYAKTNLITHRVWVSTEGFTKRCYLMIGSTLFLLVMSYLISRTVGG